jgi:flagellar biosynthesis chaperone FliJ
MGSAGSVARIVSAAADLAHQVQQFLSRYHAHVRIVDASVKELRERIPKSESIWRNNERLPHCTSTVGHLWRLLS